MMSEFHTAFYDADELIVTEIYPAGEDPIEGLSGVQIADGALAHGKKGVTFIAGLEDAFVNLRESLKPGDIVLTLGAGSITTLSTRLVDALAKS
jgi:UDP-N-acetylmuramate--alanine ligase